MLYCLSDKGYTSKIIHHFVFQFTLKGTLRNGKYFVSFWSRKTVMLDKNCATSELVVVMDCLDNKMTFLYFQFENDIGYTSKIIHNFVFQFTLKGTLRNGKYFVSFWSRKTVMLDKNCATSELVVVMDCLDNKMTFLYFQFENDIGYTSKIIHHFVFQFNLKGTLRNGKYFVSFWSRKTVMLDKNCATSELVVVMDCLDNKITFLYFQFENDIGYTSKILHHFVFQFNLKGTLRNGKYFVSFWSQKTVMLDKNCATSELVVVMDCLDNKMTFLYFQSENDIGYTSTIIHHFVFQFNLKGTLRNGKYFVSFWSRKTVMLDKNCATSELVVVMDCLDNKMTFLYFQSENDIGYTSKIIHHFVFQFNLKGTLRNGKYFVSFWSRKTVMLDKNCASSQLVVVMDCLDNKMTLF